MRYLALAGLLVLLAFFAAGEFALIRLRPSRVQVLEADGRRGASAVARLQQRLRRALVATQLGATLALVAIGWAGRGVAARLDPTVSQPWIDLLVFLALVLLATLVGGLLPKAWVLHRPEASALRLAPLLESTTRSLAPLLSVLERLSDGFLHLLGLPRNWDQLVPALSAGELETLIESNSVTGLMPDERDMLEGLFSLRDTPVREVMVPRSGMVTLPITVCFGQMMEAVHQTHHARFPVIGQSLDDVRGVLDLRRLAEPIARGELQGDTPLAPYVTPVLRVQEITPLAELLPVIRSGQPLVVVVDEHGGTEGLVTAADLTSEIVGEEEGPQNDPHDLQQLLDDTWLVAGDLEIFELNRQLGLQLPEADGHHTLAGFLLERLQHIPSAGESLSWHGHGFEIVAMDGPRIERVQITQRSSEERSSERPGERAADRSADRSLQEGT
ncbi:MAG: hemolysin family protein [Synechococcaceae cyanobacterium ELA445]|jgi:CBS domain containing-hemolysin-like protein